MFFHYGKIIKVGEKEIAINDLEDEAEAKCLYLGLRMKLTRYGKNAKA